MDYFIRKYFDIIKQLENYKKFLTISKLENNISNTNYRKYIDEIDDLLLKEYVKIEELLNDIDKFII